MYDTPLEHPIKSKAILKTVRLSLSDNSCCTRSSALTLKQTI